MTAAEYMEHSIYIVLNCGIISHLNRGLSGSWIWGVAVNFYTVLSGLLDTKHVLKITDSTSSPQTTRNAILKFQKGMAGVGLTQH